MAALALTGGVSVMRQAQAELRWEQRGAATPSACATSSKTQ
ncbi:MAG: hypothetical protein U5L74_04300 [Ideonella sp.]|nr:hypothetical protein [Ideonella sp.]